jgi:hypothetical protein
LASNPNPAENYFNLLHKARQQPCSVTDDLLKLVQMIVAALNRSELKTARVGLKSLAMLIERARPLIHNTEEIHKEITEVMILRRELLETKLELAEVSGDRASSELLRLDLERMDEFVSASITDLDPAA